MARIQAAHSEMGSRRVPPTTIQPGLIPWKILRPAPDFGWSRRKLCGVSARSDVITNNDMTAPPDPHQRLDELIKALADRTIPKLPANLVENVWREIRGRRGHPSESWVAALFDLLRRPGLAICGFMVAGALGSLFGALSVGHRTMDTRMAQQSLHLDVFAPNAPGLPVDLISRR